MSHTDWPLDDNTLNNDDDDDGNYNHPCMCYILDGNLVGKYEVILVTPYKTRRLIISLLWVNKQTTKSGQTNRRRIDQN